jgi:hypothetical protein
MTRSKNEDIQYGLKSEKHMLPLLQKKFGKELERSRKPYSPYDYRKKGVRVELKSRTNASHKYPTTMISLSKVRFAENYNGKYYFVFKFTDKTLYIRYDEETFMEFDVGTGGRSDRGTTEHNTYVYIPVAELKELH